MSRSRAIFGAFGRAALSPLGIGVLSRRRTSGVDPSPSASPPVLSGNPTVGQTLSAAPGFGYGSFIGRQWVRSTDPINGPWTEIAGATGLSIVLPQAAALQQVQLRETWSVYVDGDLAQRHIYSAPLGPVANATKPVIAGTPQSGQLLTVTPATGYETLVARIWQTSDEAGGTFSDYSAPGGGTEYTPDPDDVGLFFKVVEYWSTTAIVNVAVSGTAKVGQTLIATPATGFVSLVSREWQHSPNGTSGWQVIPGANDTSYVVEPAYEGRHIRCAETWTTDAVPLVSDPVGPVADAGGDTLRVRDGGNSTTAGHTFVLFNGGNSTTAGHTFNLLNGGDATL